MRGGPNFRNRANLPPDQIYGTIPRPPRPSPEDFDPFNISASSDFNASRGGRGRGGMDSNFGYGAPPRGGGGSSFDSSGSTTGRGRGGLDPTFLRGREIPSQNPLADIGREDYDLSSGPPSGRGGRGGIDTTFGRDTIPQQIPQSGRGGYDLSTGRGGYDQSSGRGGYDQSSGRGGRGGFDTNEPPASAAGRGGRGGFDQSTGRGGYDISSGPPVGRGGLDQSAGRGGYDQGSGRGGYDISSGPPVGRGGLDQSVGRGGYDQGSGRGGYDQGSGRGGYDISSGPPVGRGGLDQSSGRGGYDISSGPPAGRGGRGGMDSSYRRDSFPDNPDRGQSYGPPSAGRGGLGSTQQEQQQYIPPPVDQYRHGAVTSPFREERIAQQQAASAPTSRGRDMGGAESTSQGTGAAHQVIKEQIALAQAQLSVPNPAADMPCQQCKQIFAEFVRNIAKTLNDCAARLDN